MLTDQEFNRFLEKQKSGARAKRLEMLNKNLSRTQRMLEAISITQTHKLPLDYCPVFAIITFIS
jgi:hypothetical protein